MANALIYAPSGGGKTVNSTLVKAPNRGKNLLLCSDNSNIVLRNFERVNLDQQTIEHWMDTDKTGRPQVNLIKQFDAAVESGKYDNIIVDNVSDIFDMAILEMDESGRYKDMRQAYQTVYQGLKRLVRKAGQLDCNVIFTAWHEVDEIVTGSGEVKQRVKPKLPMKILDNFLGLCNVVAYVNSTEVDSKGNPIPKRWFYVLSGSQTMYAKDQIHCRKACKPENIFEEEK